MVRIFSAFFALALAAGAALPVGPQQVPPSEGAPVQGNPYGPPAANSSAHLSDAAMLARAKKIFGQLQNGKIDRSEISTNTPNTGITDATISNAQRMIGNLGKPASFVQQRTTTQGNTSATLYLVTFQNGQQIEFLFMVDNDGKVNGLALGTPH